MGVQLDEVCLNVRVACAPSCLAKEITITLCFSRELGSKLLLEMR